MLSIVSVYLPVHLFQGMTVLMTTLNIIFQNEFLLALALHIYLVSDRYWTAVFIYFCSCCFTSLLEWLLIHLE